MRGGLLHNGQYSLGRAGEQGEIGCLPCRRGVFAVHSGEGRVGAGLPIDAAGRRALPQLECLRGQMHGLPGPAVGGGLLSLLPQVPVAQQVQAAAIDLKQVAAA